MALTDIFASEFLTRIVMRSMAVGILVSLCASVLGVSLVLKRYSMIGDGLSHVGFFALALSACAGVSSAWSMEVSAVIVVIAAVLILRLSKNEGKLNGDSACAVVTIMTISTESEVIRRLIFW